MGEESKMDKPIIKRERYLKQIREFYDSDLVKIITGIKGSGKSIVLEQIMEEVKAKSENVLYLNFENAFDLLKAGSVESLIGYVRAFRKPGKCYLFLDEVQWVENWQIAVKDLRLQDCSIFVAGSNSELLSDEATKHLSGRFISMRVRPFVYKEIADYASVSGFKMDPNDYLVWGGFPGRLETQTAEAAKRYLEDLFSAIVLNDLISRYQIRKTAVFLRVVNFILFNNARTFSIRSIYRTINADFPDISLATVAKYVDYLKSAYIIDEIPQYSLKAKRELSFYGKVYDADVGLNAVHVSDNRFDLDHNLENIVYNELLYMGYDVKAFNNGGKEIDFRASKDGKVYYIQVAYSVADPKAYQREFDAFKGLDDLNQRVLITTDPFDYSTSTVRHIRFADFLLMNDLQ